MGGVTASGFLGGLLLERSRAHGRLILGGALVANLAALGAFKYFRFFADSFASFLAGVGLRADGATLSLVLPIGISYYVFQNLSYVMDVYRRDLVATTGVVEYATALSFFPQLLAGPLTRPRDLLPQLFQRRTFDDQRARDGLRQILWGLTKKMLIADNIGMQVDYVWVNIGSVDGLTLLIAAVLYSIQIHCDFSGYADSAIGSAKLFNLRLSKDFDYPYFSTSVQMFWRRWHITLALGRLPGALHATSAIRLLGRSSGDLCSVDLCSVLDVGPSSSCCAWLCSCVRRRESNRAQRHPLTGQPTPFGVWPRTTFRAMMRVVTKRAHLATADRDVPW